MKKVVEILEATTGGTRRHLNDLVSGLDRRRFEVSLVVSPLRKDPEFEKDIERFRRAGVGLRMVAMPRRIAPVADLAALFKLWRILRETAPDIVHAHSSKAGILGRAAARLAGVPRVVYTPHGYSFEMQVSGLGRALYRAIEKMAARWTDAHVCVCRSELEKTLGLGVPPGKCHLVYNGIGIETKGSRGRSAGGNRRRLVGCIGRLCPQKGQDVLVEAAPAILRGDPGIHLLFVGSGPLRALVEDRLREWQDAGRISVLGEVPEAEIGHILEELDILVIPSRWEGLPYGLLDAMARGVAVVASRVGGIPEMVSDGKEGLLVSPEDPEALAEAVLCCAGDDALRQRLGEAARKRVADRTVQAMIEALERVYSGTSAEAPLSPSSISS